VKIILDLQCGGQICQLLLFNRVFSITATLWLASLTVMFELCLDSTYSIDVSFKGIFAVPHY